ncbi:sulfatase-like hydrolase/transferase [Halalkalicoccus jeotgali]|uniref:Sulfatase n=1 Tax=Halalkalicoccus jeotgali (strain DSM 18796 / CECT 7217 / JCM 14584 / KCTC 4019 / B3) TaxID=795797 RepID=D8J4N8_HALJB|nr:sulfatase-like hydrolase/transferase [Halalkalicoccus jeotgali]ADJ15505.1 sulfatase [Halalkalicoccus jeotgali B3]ELY36086.1 sulfatase [Halalkalicoccus jeotgali B3]
MNTLLLTVDSLRNDYFERMPATRAFLDRTHDRAFATCTATMGSFPAIVGGEYATGTGLEGESVANTFENYSVGITTNHLLSASYGYDAGFDSFTSPKGDGETLKDKGAIHLTRGTLPYEIARWGWDRYQQLKGLVGEVEKSFRPAEDVIEEFLTETAPHEEWFGWLHFMEPHHPYDPDDAPVSREAAQRMTRRVLAGRGSKADEELVCELYEREVRELDHTLETLWEAIPDDTRVVFCADHGELLGEGGLWGHPGEMRPELLRVPFGTRNAPELGEVVSLIDVPTVLRGEDHGLGTLDREVAFAAYGDRKAAMNVERIATSDETCRLTDGESTNDPELERALDRFDPGYVVKEDALLEDLEDLGYA